MGQIVSQSVDWGIPLTDLPGQRGRVQGFRLRVRDPRGEVAEVYYLQKRPRLMYLRGSIPEGCAAELDQAMYTVGKRRVYVTIAQYFNLPGDAIGEVLDRLNKAKGPGFNTPTGVEAMVQALTVDLLHSVKSKNEAGLRAAMRTIEKHKAMLTTAQSKQLADMIAGNWAKAVAGIENLPGYKIALQEGGIASVSAARRATLEDMGLEKAITFAPNVSDETAIIEMAGNRGFFIKDAYGLREGRTARKAQSIMAPMLKEGLGREDMARSLKKELGTYMKREDLNYWTTVADNHITRTRSWGNLSSMADAGLESFTVEAVLDEATSDICRYMHGQVISIPAAQALTLNSESVPRHMDKVNPFMQSRAGPQGSTILSVPEYKGKQVTQRTVATSKSPGVGIPNSTGKWNAKISGNGLTDKGIGTPPYHHRCRTTIIPTGGQIPTAVPPGPKPPKPKPKRKNPRIVVPPPPPKPPPPPAPAAAPKPEPEPFRTAFNLADESPNTWDMPDDKANAAMLSHWEKRLPAEKADFAAFVEDNKSILDAGRPLQFKELCQQFVRKTGMGKDKGAWRVEHRAARGTKEIKDMSNPRLEGKRTSLRGFTPMPKKGSKYHWDRKTFDKVSREINGWADKDTITKHGQQRAAAWTYKDPTRALTWKPENQRITLWIQGKKGTTGQYAGTDVPWLDDDRQIPRFRYRRNHHIAMRPARERYGSEAEGEWKYQYDTAHEHGHVFQELNPNIDHLGKAIVEKRIKDTGAKRVWQEGGKYWYYPDTRMITNYCSASYGSWAPGIEYTSEGLAHFYMDPMKLFEHDPEHFYYITAMLRGGI